MLLTPIRKHQSSFAVLGAKPSAKKCFCFTCQAVAGQITRVSDGKRAPGKLYHRGAANNIK